RLPAGEDVLHHPVSAVLLEQRPLPDVLSRAEVPVVVIETCDESGPVLVGLVLRAGIPQVEMTVDDEDLVAARRSEHGSTPPEGRPARPARVQPSAYQRLFSPSPYEFFMGSAQGWGRGPTTAGGPQPNMKTFSLQGGSEHQ